MNSVTLEIWHIEVYFFAVHKKLVDSGVDRKTSEIIAIAEKYREEHENALLEMAMLESERKRQIEREGKNSKWKDYERWHSLFHQLNNKKA